MGSIFRFLAGPPFLRLLHGFIEFYEKRKLARVADRSGDSLPDNAMDGLIHIVRQAFVNLHILSPRSLKPTAMSIAYASNPFPHGIAKICEIFVNYVCQKKIPRTQEPVPTCVHNIQRT
jgi:hypothetical protein